MLRPGARALLPALLFWACDAGAPAPSGGPSPASRGGEPAEPSRSVTALVAASAKDAVEEIAVLFRETSGAGVRVSAGPSNALATQILAGAPAGVFLSASEEWADKLQAEGRAAAVVDLLGNAVVLIVPKGNPAAVRRPEDLESPAVRKVALAGENVPAGKYAEQALRALGIYSRLETAGKIARGQDVRTALSYVERGEAEAGIVYSTDARISKDVEVAAELDPRSHDRVVYSLVLVGPPAAGDSASRELFDFVQGEAAAAIFRKHGFTRLP